VEAARILRHALEVSGLSRRALARRAGTSAATLAAYESGRVVPSVAVFARIVDAAGLTPTLTLTPTVAGEDGRGPRFSGLRRT